MDSFRRQNKRAGKFSKEEKQDYSVKRAPRRKFYEYPKISYLVEHHAAAGDPFNEKVLDKICSQSTVIVEEKIDGANMRVWFDGKTDPLVGNRTNVLMKGYVEKNTPAKLQFRPFWNWLYEHAEQFKVLTQLVGSTPIVYGEWCLAYHTVSYDKLPDFFIAYDLLVEMPHGEWDFLPVKQTRMHLATAGFEVPPMIASLPSEEVTLDKLKEMSVGPSMYGPTREGIVVRGNVYKAKIVDPAFSPRKDFNDTPLVKNSKINGKSNTNQGPGNS